MCMCVASSSLLTGWSWPHFHNISHASLRCVLRHAFAVHEALDLLDAALVGAGGLHDLVEDRDVEGHHGDGGAGLGDERLVDGNPGFADASWL